MSRPDVGVGHDLERERREGLVVVGLAQDLVVLLEGEVTLERRDVERAGQELHDRVEHELDALVLERRATEHGHALVREGGAADRAAELLDRGLLLGDELLHQGFVVVGELLEELVAAGLGRRLVLVGDLGVLPVLPHLAFPVVALHLDEVDDPVEVGLGAPGELEDERVRAEAVDDHAHRALEVGAGAVHLVHEADARDGVAVGLAPDGLGLRLDTGDRVEDGDGAVEHAQGPLDLDREVDVAWRVDDVDPVALPLTGGGRRGDRDAALALLRHPVHLGRALVDLADLVGLAGVVQDALGRGRLTGVDVGHDADVARAREGVFADVQRLPLLDVLLGLSHLHLLRGARHLGSSPLNGNPALGPGLRLLVVHHQR